MKVRSGFKLMKVGVQNLVVAVDERAEEFNGMIRLNPTGAFLWELLEKEAEKEAEKEELVAALLSEYEIDKETAETDVDRFLSILTDNGILE